MNDYVCAIGNGTVEHINGDHCFLFSLDGNVYRTIMTPEESQHVHAVVRRAIANPVGPTQGKPADEVKP